LTLVENANQEEPAPSPATRPGVECLEGVVRRLHRKTCLVETPRGTFQCLIRGRLLKGYLRPGGPRAAPESPERLAPIAVGDRVKVCLLPDGTAVVEEVYPRERAYVRVTAGPRPTVLAGVDQLIIVFAAHEPEPVLPMLDRFLVIAEADGLEPIICINKIDLGWEHLKRALECYRRAGYTVVLTSARTGEGLEELRRLLWGKVSAFVGPSGVGKTSLLNALKPGLGLRVREVSRATGRGRHTTTVIQLFPLDGPEAGAIADMPGLRTLSLAGIAPEDLDQYFREFRPYLGRCAFSDCTHRLEPGCAVRAAVERGAICRERYEAYLRLWAALAGESAG
jgi:ribosome biogenesis GTPase